MSDMYKKIVILIFSLIASLILCELFLRIIREPIQEIESVYDYTQLNINYGLEFKPKYNYKEFGYGGKTDSLGFYSPQISLEKRGKRIAYIGDSYIIAPGIALEENFPYKVSKKLSQEYKNLDYLAAAIGGLSPFSNKFIYQKKISQFKPDIVIYQSFDNDIGDDYIFAYSEYFAKIKVWNSVPPFLKNSMVVQQLIVFATGYFRSSYELFYEDTKEVIKDDPEKVWNEYSKPSLDELLRIVRESGAKFILVYIPSGQVFPNEYIGKPLEKKYILAALLKEWAKENKVPFVDMYDDFLKRNTEEFNEIYLPEGKGFHLTREVADLLSDKLYHVVRQNL